VSSNKANPTDLVLEIEFHDKPVPIAFYIENYSIALQYTGARIFLFQFVKVLKFRFFSLPVPSSQLLLAIRMLGPKISQSPFCNYSQIEIFKTNIRKKLPLW
jgi:hypothetical protein